jgi:hypothetical protein
MTYPPYDYGYAETHPDPFGESLEERVAFDCALEDKRARERRHAAMMKRVRERREADADSAQG